MRLGIPLYANRNLISRLSVGTRPCLKWRTPNATRSRPYATEPPLKKKFPTFADEAKSLWTWLRTYRNPEKDRTKDWILGNEVVVYHLRRPHRIYTAMNVFPFVAILWGAARLDSLWAKRNTIPSEEDANSATDEPAKTKPRISDSSRRSGTVSAVLIVSVVIGAWLFFQRKIVRTVAFRTDKPALSNPIHTGRSLDKGRSMVILRPFGGPPMEVPINESGLFETNSDDRMLIGVPGKSLKLLVDIDGAEVGIEGQSQIIQRFDKDHTGASVSAEEKRQQRIDVRNLLGRLWMAYERGKLQI